MVKTLSDWATAKATNAASKGRFVTASYCDFTIVAFAAVAARAISVAVDPISLRSQIPFPVLNI